MSITTNKVIGGSFIIDELDVNRITTPEDFTSEHKMIGAMTRDFISGEIEPVNEEIEKLNYELTVEKLRKAGELGLLGAEIPEAYGGLGLDKVSSTLISENLSKGSAFSLSFGAHVGIGTLPIVYFGNEEQKKRYLPLLGTGEKIAAYCLTEPSSGSDALGAKTTAVPSADGTYYTLNVTKQFITNAGFADIFIVYAKVDGKMSTFIVERDMEGVSFGNEEKKLGIKGSSTRQVILEDVKVPTANLLWEVGKGHYIAFNILNIGRYKLAAGCVGATKDAIELSAKYANTRHQFGVPISSFSLIGNKLANMNVKAFALESMAYRTAGLFDEGLAEVDYSSADVGQQSAQAIAEYQIECSINKVYGSEVLGYATDEAMQIHGGYGYTQEYRVERNYRDARINRIFEGTNEINRLLIPGSLVKKAFKGQLPLLQKAMALQTELLDRIPMPLFNDTLEEEAHLINMAKKVFLMVGGQAVQKYQTQLDNQQEVLSNMADIMIAVYTMESVLARTQKLIASQGLDAAKLAITMTTIHIHEEFAKIEAWAREVLALMETGDVLRTQLSILKKLVRQSTIDTIGLKREVAAKVIEKEGYVI
jgi:alkylation response protein AidB-like acyl-CoA dehydrogenase